MKEEIKQLQITIKVASDVVFDLQIRKMKTEDEDLEKIIDFIEKIAKVPKIP